MLVDVTCSQYTNQRVKVHPSYGVWYQFIPSTEDEFKVYARKVVKKFDPMKMGMRIASVNAALGCCDAQDVFVDFKSTLEDWETAFWHLYRRGFLCMAYLKEDPSAKQIFMLPFRKQDRKY